MANTKKYVSLSKLQTFLENLNNKFATIVHKHTTADLSDYIVDTELSATSTNPVQNKILNEEFEAIATAMNALDASIDSKANATHNHAISDVINLQITLDTKSDIDHNHSFNDLEDLPFGEGFEEVLSWNGRTSGLESGAFDGTSYYKIGEFMSYDSLIGCTIVMSDGSTVEITSSNLTQLSDGLLMTYYIVSVPENSYSNDEFYAYFNKSGLYAVDPSVWSNVYVKQIVKSAVVTLDDKYISDNISRVEHTHSFNDLEDKPFGEGDSTEIMSWAGSTSGLNGVYIDGTVWYRIDDYIAPETLLNSKALMSDGTVIEFAENNMEIRNDGYAETQYIRLVPTDNYSADVYELFDTAGLYHIAPTAFNVYTRQIVKPEINTLDDKYIPDSIARTIDVDTAIDGLNTAVNNKADIEHTHSIEDVDNLQVTLDAMKSDHDWLQIYDSGEITAQVNSFANINISGYKKLMVAIKCVNDTTNAPSTRYGSAIFTATNGTTYQLPVFNSMFSASENTSATLGLFDIIDGWIICPQAVRSVRYADFLTEAEGGTATNMNGMGGAVMKCTNTLSTMTVSSLDQAADYYFGVGSRVIVWGCRV